MYAFIQQELDNYYRLQDRLDLDKMEEKNQEEMEEKFGQKEQDELNESYKESKRQTEERKLKERENK